MVVRSAPNIRSGPLTAATDPPTGRLWRTVNRILRQAYERQMSGTNDRADLESKLPYGSFDDAAPCPPNSRRSKSPTRFAPNSRGAPFLSGYEQSSDPALSWGLGRGHLPPPQKACVVAAPDVRSIRTANQEMTNVTAQQRTPVSHTAGGGFLYARVRRESARGPQEGNFGQL